MMQMGHMKKSGYTLFSDKTRKMILAIGISMLSVCTMNVLSYASPTIEGQFKKTVDQQTTRYQVKLQETEENATLNLYTQKDNEDEILVQPIVWQKHDNEILAVVEVINNQADKLIVRNNIPGSEPKSVLLSNFTLDNEGPKIQWAYKNIEQNYIQFEARDVTNIYRVVDQEHNDRIKIDEKDQDTVLTAKYVLESQDKEFYLYDVLGNETKIDVEQINTTYTIAAKNADGQKVVLNMALPENASLRSVETVKGEDITSSQNITKQFKGEDGDNLVAIYSGVSEGTTYLKVNYELNDKIETIRVLLDLDVTAPIVVQYNDNGEEVETGGNLRAYKNEAGDKAIVEVKDMVSGITKIVVCIGTEECNEPNQKFEINNLPTSVVQLMDLPENATGIRVYDGIGNVFEIDLDTVVSKDNGEKIELGMTIDEQEVVTASIIDKKAGLKKFVRSKEEGALDKSVDDTYERNYEPQNVYQSIQTKEDIQKYYPVKKQEITLRDEELQGVPEFTAIDIFENTKEFNMNKILFKADSIIMATSGQEEETIVKAMVVNLKEVRRIKKITATINDEEVVLETFETKSSNLGKGPKELEKAYELPDNSHVSKITIYHSEDDVTQNIIPVDFTTPSVEPGQEPSGDEDNPIIQIPEEEPGDGEEDIRKEFVEIDTEGTEEGITIVKIKYGIKKIAYSDECIIEFFEDLPKEVEVYTKDELGSELETVIITDALGYTYDISNGSEDIQKYGI